MNFSEMDRGPEEGRNKGGQLGNSCLGFVLFSGARLGQ